MLLHTILHTAATRAALRAQGEEAEQLHAQLVGRAYGGAVADVARYQSAGLRLDIAPCHKTPAPDVFLASCLRSATWLWQWEDHKHAGRGMDLIRMSLLCLGLQAGQPRSSTQQTQPAGQQGSSSQAAGSCTPSRTAMRVELSPASIAAVDCLGQAT